MIKNLNFSYIFFSFLSCIIFLLVGLYLGVLYQRQTQLQPIFSEKTEPEISSIEIASVLPEGALLRDYEKLEGIRKDSYLVMYIERGYKFSSWDYYTCPGSILGDAIEGIYHLALFKDKAFVSDIKIPIAYKEYSDLPFELSFKNTKGNLYQKGEYSEEERERLEVVKLLKLDDYTGDGKPYEALLTTTAGGCGFYDGLVAGYDPETNSVTLYSDWIHRFHPDNNGKFSYLFQCGDHGNNIKIEREYAFDNKEKRFKMTWEKETPCFPL